MRNVGLFTSVVMVLASLGCAPDWEGVFGGGSEGGSNADGGATNASGPTTTTSESTSTSASGAGPATTTTTGGAPSTSSGPSTDATTTGPDTTTSGPGATTDATTTSTTSGEPVGVFVDCGGEACDVTEGGACCLVFENQNEASVTCQPDENQCESFLSTSMQCDDPFDCDGGKVCCAVRDQSGQFYERTSCESNCDGQDRVVCEPNGPACEPIVNNQGQTVPTMCQQSQLLPPGYQVCAGN
jgi:hypothetical protein